MSSNQDQLFPTKSYKKAQYLLGKIMGSSRILRIYKIELLDREAYKLSATKAISYFPDSVSVPDTLWVELGQVISMILYTFYFSYSVAVSDLAKSATDPNRNFPLKETGQRIELYHDTFIKAFKQKIHEAYSCISEEILDEVLDQAIAHIKSQVSLWV